MLAAFSAGKLVFWKSEKHLPYTLKRSLFSLDHNGALLNFINLLALLLIWRGLWTYWLPTVSVGFILRMFLGLQKTDLVLILLFRFSSRSIAYNLFPGGFTPVGLDQGRNQGLFLYIFGLVGFGFTRQLCKQTNGLHMTKLYHIYIFRWHCSQVLMYLLSYILIAINLKVLPILHASQAHFGNLHWFWPKDIGVKAPSGCGFTLPCQLKREIIFKFVSAKKKIVELPSHFHT